jgi:hypothetical protein
MTTLGRPKPLEVHEDDFQVQDPNKEVKPALQQPPEQIVTKVPDPAGATEPCRSQGTQAKPQQLVPSLCSTKSCQRTDAVNTKCHPVTATTNAKVHLVHPEEHEDQNRILVAHHIMTHHSKKADMKHFKERGEQAASKELHQLHFQDTFEPVDPKDLRREERQEVLESHMFLKQKQDARTVEGRVVAAGNKQEHGKIDKLEPSSPTAAATGICFAHSCHRRT